MAEDKDFDTEPLTLEFDTETLTLDPWQAFAYFVSKCGEEFGAELMKEGKTETQARNAVIGCFLDFAAGEACRVARREGREPNHEKWTKVVDDAFARAVKRTAVSASDQG